MASVARTENGNGVGEVSAGAVPVSDPPLVRLNQPGRLIPVKVIAPVPPVVLKFCE